MRDDGACCSKQMGNGSLLQLQEKATRGLSHSHEGRRTWGPAGCWETLRDMGNPVRDQFQCVPLRHKSAAETSNLSLQCRREGLGSWPASGSVCPEALCSQFHPGSRAWTIHFFLHSLFGPRRALLDPGDAITGSSWSPGAHSLVWDTGLQTSANG